MKKIMFNDQYGLTQAVVDLIKTNTRRAEKSLDVLPLDYNPLLTEFQFEYKDGIIIGRRFFKGSYAETYHIKPRYKIGEEVAVSQAYSSIFDELEANVSLQEARPILEQSESAGWDNKMFVKASLMLHRIRITDIKAERLQDISEEDCLREGVNKDNMPSFNSAGYEIDITYYWVEGINKNFEDPYEAFAALIDHISGKGTWERNPWVLAYEIELVK